MQTSEAPTSIRIDRVAHSRVQDVDLANVPFSTVFSDHMFVAEFHDGHWSDGRIQPYGPISVMPNISALHYGISVFEGMKAHKSSDGRPLLFRAKENARRLQRSAARLAMPVVPESMFLEALRELVRLDQAWIPPADQGAMYIRPILFSVDPSIRPKPADSCQFLILTFPFGAYFAAPVDALVSERYVRAFPGGTGDTKPAGNYAAALLAPPFPPGALCRAQNLTSPTLLKVTTATSNWCTVASNVRPNFGDYIGTAPGGNHIFATWADGRNGVPDTFYSTLQGAGKSK